MTNVKGYFGGNFLKAEDCKGGELCEILAEGEMDEIKTPSGKTKEVLNYAIKVDGVEKMFTPNKANGLIMMEAWGEDDKAWVGKKFTIALEKANVFGERKNTIVVQPVDEKIAAKI